MSGSPHEDDPPAPAPHLPVAVPPVVVAAGVVVRRNGRILLQRRGDDGTWGLPGGRLEAGESLEQCARRELLEETGRPSTRPTGSVGRPRGGRGARADAGLSAGALRLVDVYSGPEFVVSYPDGNAFHVVGATFETDDVSGELVEDGVETIGLAWLLPAEVDDRVNPYNRRLLERAGLGPAGQKNASTAR